jgi:hypothetical protein
MSVHPLTNMHVIHAKIYQQFLCRDKNIIHMPFWWGGAVSVWSIDLRKIYIDIRKTSHRSMEKIM